MAAREFSKMRFVPEQLCQRDVRGDDDLIRLAGWSFECATARQQIVNDVLAVRILGAHHDLHHRFQNDRVRSLCGIDERRRSSRSESVIGRICLVVRPVAELDSHTDDLISVNDPGIHRIADAVLDRGHEAPRDALADRCVAESLARGGIEWAQSKHDVRIFPPRGDADLRAAFSGTSECLTVLDGRPANGRVDAELASETLEDAFEIQLCGRADDRSLRSSGSNGNGRTLRDDDVEGLRKLVAISGRVRHDVNRQRQ